MQIGVGNRGQVRADGGGNRGQVGGDKGGR